jgi:hypothetical protein
LVAHGCADAVLEVIPVVTLDTNATDSHLYAVGRSWVWGVVGVVGVVGIVGVVSATDDAGSTGQCVPGVAAGAYAGIGVPGVALVADWLTVAVGAVVPIGTL